MGEGRRRRGAPKRALIGPLVMLAGGAVAGVTVWRLLMLEPVRGPAPERLSRQERQALDRVLEEHRSP